LAALPATATAAGHAPRSRYDFANRCWSVAGHASEPLFFKPTTLGAYMIDDTAGRLLTASAGGAVTRGTQPGPSAEWRARRLARGVYELRASVDGRALTLGGATRLRFTPAHGCRPYPELDV